jgi:hypothetical protein
MDTFNTNFIIRKNNNFDISKNKDENGTVNERKWKLLKNITANE